MTIREMVMLLSIFWAITPQSATQSDPTDFQSGFGQFISIKCRLPLVSVFHPLIILGQKSYPMQLQKQPHLNTDFQS
jgi:hypothetical protein